jgi:hypothetical protein
MRCDSKRLTGAVAALLLAASVMGAEGFVEQKGKKMPAPALCVPPPPLASLTGA